MGKEWFPRLVSNPNSNPRSILSRFLSIFSELDRFQILALGLYLLAIHRVYVARSGLRFSMAKHCLDRSKAMSEDRDYKSIVIPCKVCAREFELRLPMIIYETTVAVAEAEDETAEFAGTCPDCRKGDPFLRMLDGANIPTVGRDFARKINR